MRKNDTAEPFGVSQPRGAALTAVLSAFVLALPVSFGVWAVQESRALRETGKRAATLATVYERALQAKPSLTGTGVRSSVAVRRIRSALQGTQSEGDGADQALGRGIFLSLNAYSSETVKLLTAGRRGDARSANRLSHRRKALGRSIRGMLRDASALYHRTAVESVDESSHAKDLALVSSLALAALMPFVMRKRRRQGEDDAAEAAAEAAENDLRDLALTDNLTGLRNHRAFQEDLVRELERRNRGGGVLALMMIDLDGLKEVNDTNGHQAGDERIKILADSLRRTMRQADIAYRVGGDEFTVILPRERAWGAFEFAQRLRTYTAAANVGVAIGITETTTYELKDAVIRRADLALIEAKRSNRSTVIYSDGLEPKRKGSSSSAKAAGEHHSRILATALARAVDAKDGSTRNHCETVSELCVRIGSALALSGERLEKLRVAGLLHDVGKIGIADAILQKPGVLDEEETEVMRTHAQIGHSIITAAELHDEAAFVLHHHERVDGTGYPEGLAGEQIPLESRIILVADTFEAVTSDRAYRSGRSHDEALQELQRHAGAQFDPDCVEALRGALGIDGPATHQRAVASVTQLRPHVAA